MAKKKPGTMIDIGERTIELTSEKAMMFPDAKITKGDLVNYYLEVAFHMLPRVEDRPLTLERFQRGIKARGFIMKRAPDSYPDWIRRAHVPSKSKKGQGADHAVCDEAATLVYLANQRAVTFHVGPTRCDRLDGSSGPNSGLLSSCDSPVRRRPGRRRGPVHQVPQHRGLDRRSIDAHRRQLDEPRLRPRRALDVRRRGCSPAPGRPVGAQA